ncbi:YgfZ/GcvT domain-containing protein [Pseudohalioglobus lutimaris]|uniref:CAF17-like 4Fe-4S cluster assembly/insertion protein YgfZ n=1 Tax=Pseudohalioglobus lutimaris TaxID=1737061 RepID=UPI0013FDBEEA|nr:folate-binding protein YgfZ [Pseudohalioglobus lutimaris]
MPAHYALLKDEGLLHISGPDTLKFLQGQTTCDTRKVDAGHALPGAFCTPKGRMICDFLLAQVSADHYVLRMRNDTVALAATAFGKYIMFSKATLDGDRQDWKTVACWGENVRSALAGLKLSVPSARYAATSGEGYILIQMDDQGEQFEAYLDMQAFPQHFEALAQTMDAGEEEDWRTLQIESGIGRVEAPTSGEFLPQMLNYDVTGHVSFNKGCYTGQEIVARLHYRGKSKRRLYLARFGASVPLPAGTDLFSPGTDQANGTVVNSAAADGGHVCLVSATEAGVAAGLHLRGHDQALEIEPLPYTLPD